MADPRRADRPAAADPGPGGQRRAASAWGSAGPAHGDGARRRAVAGHGSARISGAIPTRRDARKLPIAIACGWPTPGLPEGPLYRRTNSADSFVAKRSNARRAATDPSETLVGLVLPPRSSHPRASRHDQRASRRRHITPSESSCMHSSGDITPSLRSHAPRCVHLEPQPGAADWRMEWARTGWRLAVLRLPRQTQDVLWRSCPCRLRLRVKMRAVEFPVHLCPVSAGSTAQLSALCWVLRRERR
jgi:hypothetical protein